MNIFYIVRHGLKENKKGDPGLTDNGKEQALKTGIFLKNKNVELILSSQFKRAQESAYLINKSLTVGVKVDKRLSERMNWGSIPGQTLEELLVEWDKSTKNRDYIPVGGISSRESGNNMKAALNDALDENMNSNYIIVAHGGIIMDFIRNIASERDLLKFEKKSPEMSGKESSIATIIFEKGLFKVEDVGSTSHL